MQWGVQQELTLFKTLDAELLLALTHSACPALPCQQGHRMGRDPVYLYCWTLSRGAGAHDTSASLAFLPDHAILPADPKLGGTGDAWGEGGP